MAWIRLDDQIAHHPKFVKCSPAACWFYVTCIGFAQKFLTDGVIPKASLITLSHVRRPQQCIAELVRAGLLEIVTDGYQIHDYLDHNSSANEVRADREWDRFRKELYSNPSLVAAIKKRDRNRCRYCGIEVNWADRRGPNGGQFDHVIARGPNTLDNIVVACRRCNIVKGNRSLEQAGMSLIPSSEPEPNQVGTSSDLDLRARASYPSHPIPSLKDKDPSSKANGSNGHQDARSKRPIFAGQRLVVHEFMLTDCMNVLAEHTDEFDLHAWFFDLDAMAVNKGLVIPKRDHGAWLQSQLVAEAQRRGIPLTMARPIDEVAGKQTRRLMQAVANIRREAQS